MNGSINNATSASTSSVPQIKSDDEVVAVVGMAMRLPGGVRCGDDFWNLLAEKRSCLSKFPPNRLNPSGHLDSSTGTEGHFLHDIDIRDFDPSVFPMPRMELAQLDPVQRQLLQVVYECLEDAGAVPQRDTDNRIGCYVGCSPTDWFSLMSADTLSRGPYRSTGAGNFATANRISFEFGLNGPSMAIDTACSSALTCLDSACQAIRSGACDGAIVCGAYLAFSPSTLLMLRDGGLFSPSNTCKTFDASADNYGRGEAINAVYIKRLDKALQDGAMFIPSVSTQEALIRRAYQDAGIEDLGQTAMFECHGTGTTVGDVVETEAVGRCFAKDGVIITSVKPNIGHSEVASGITSLIKAILALERRQVPPNIFFEKPNPEIPFKLYKLHVPVEVEQWPEGRAERVSVNSFGMGGANTHVIVDSLAQYRCDQGRSHHLAASLLTPNESEPQETQLLILSASSDASLGRLVDSYQVCVKEDKVPLADISFTLARRRRHKSHRAYAIAGAGELIHISVGQDSPTPSRILWVFTGQGAQWAGMGAELLETDPVFRDSIRRLDAHLSTLLPPPSWTIDGELRKTVGFSLVDKAEFMATLIVAVQIGLVDVLRSWKITPDIVVGHSSGEIAAAYASGAITAEAAISAAFFRGAVCSETGQAGAMAAVGLGPLEVAPYLEAGVVIACKNSQANVTLSGDAGQVDKVVRKLKQSLPDVLIRRLKIEMAYHSHHMSKRGAIYEETMSSLFDSVEPAVPFFSSYTGKRLKGEHSLGPAYWRANLENPVEFNAAVRSALGQQEDDRVLVIEVGPHNALQGYIGQIVKDMGRQDDIYVPTLRRGQSCREGLLRLAGELFRNKVGSDYSYCCGPDGCHVHSLPRYPWIIDTSHWAETRMMREYRLRDKSPHPLLGSPVVEVFHDMECSWRNYLSVEKVPWLTDHKVEGFNICPAAALIAMIGEALRQLTRKREYSLRKVYLTSALIVPHRDSIEVITSLKKESPESPWYFFTVSFLAATGWTRCISGEARGGIDLMPPIKTHGRQASLERPVDVDRWYRSLHNIGYHYDGLFRGLRQVTASPVNQSAEATASFIDEEERYAMHPATIDICLQAMVVAATRGLSRNRDKPAIPVFFGEIFVRPPTEDLSVTADLFPNPTGGFYGYLSAQASGETYLSVREAETAEVQLGVEKGAPEELVSEIEWVPHADLTPSADGICRKGPVHTPWESRCLEEITLLFCVDHLETTDRSKVTEAHLLRHLDWMRQHVDNYQLNPGPLTPTELQLCNLTREERLSRIEELCESGIRKCPNLDLVRCMFRNYDSIVSGKLHALEVLMKDNLFARVHESLESLDYSNYLHTLAHTNPKMKILEIGAGTCVTTATMLRILTSPQGRPMYESYYVTDISSLFISNARERFATFKGVEYGTFDITRDPKEQGLEDKYDLIVGTNVVHATPNLGATLRNLRGLLSNEGRLFLSELNTDMKFINYSMGFLSSWWDGVSDDRDNGDPYVTPERWAKELLSAGFRQPDIVQTDAESPYNLMMAIIAAPQIALKLPATVTLLTHDKDGPYVQQLTDSLGAIGITTDVRIFGQPVPCQDIFCLLDLQSPTLHDLNESSFGTLVKYLQSIEKSTMIWVTPASQTSCSDPRYGLINGFARSVRQQFQVHLHTIELDEQSQTPSATSAAILTKVYLHTQRSQTSDKTPRWDWEFAIVDGNVLVPRAVWLSLEDAFVRSADGPQHDANRALTVGKPGLLQTIGWRTAEREKPGHGEVLVKLKAGGLNFRDFMLSLGLLKFGDRPLGFEASGVIVEVGEDIQDLSVGDRVFFMKTGSMQSYTRVSQNMCRRFAPHLTFEEAAASPVAFATAIRGIIDKAQMSAGQTILIHSACGGFGLAAIQVALTCGAEIFCTVSSDEKRDYLVRTHGIPPSHIFNSRDSSFLYGIMEATCGRGVDVVLNSLSGELLRTSWKCVASCGIMIELGKVDMRQRCELSLELFEENRTLTGISLDHLSEEALASLLERISSMLISGAIKSLPITRRWSHEEAQTAIQVFTQGNHIGKMVIGFPDDCCSIPAKPRANFIRLRPDCSYLLVGGTSGLGLATSTWLVEKGARYLIFLSRSAGVTLASQRLKDDLCAQGCSVQMVRGDVANASDVEKAVKQAAKPIAGVINFAMVLKNAGLVDMTFAEWSETLAPKVQGTWNLHNLVTTDLDFFILCSSLIGIFGQSEQSNYAASSTFLDSFMKYRHQLGLVASVIDMGGLSDVGILTHDASAKSYLERLGIRFLTESEILSGVQLAICRSKPTRPSTRHGSIVGHDPGQVMIGMTLSSSDGILDHIEQNLQFSRFTSFKSSKGSSPARAVESRSDLMASAAADPSILEKNETTGLIATEIASALCNILLRKPGSISIDQNPTQFGLDSLVAVELRHWIWAQFNIRLTSAFISSVPSLEFLAEHLRQAMLSTAAASHT
ncbi:hypothetical protein CP532_3626 [Ophiocordyceps camponoti-leonardi (nom. inval.)]|nr:hypothetical protein CP532_3626 [Ophiocordyceps camponoti-leonardi (nom. inval.)]